MKTFYRIILKRVIDALCAFTAIAILSPLLAVITLVLLIYHKGRPFFIQVRPGKDEKPFKLIKFKSMHDVRAQGPMLSHRERITPIGWILRKTSLDELTQLFNVLKGDMSLIGPRPLLVEYLPYYTAEERLRHAVKPGITGWAQVNGRNLLSWDKRLQADLHYVEHLSLPLDMMIMIKTVKNVFTGKDVIVDETGGVSFDQYRMSQNLRMVFNAGGRVDSY